MIFPQLAPQYYDETDRGLLSRMEAFYAEGITINQSFWGEADTDTRFEAGDQTLWNDLYGNLPANRRRQFQFNRIRRTKNMIGGHQRRNRKSTVAIGVANADDETADQYTKILSWVNRQQGIDETISQAFDGALVTGMNLLQVWVDYRSDPINGDIRVDNCSYNSFMIDPFFRKPDLSDCRAIWKRSFLTKRECISMFPKRADEIMGLISNDSGTGRDGKFQFMPESYGYSYKNFMTYDEFWYRDYRTQKMIVDSRTGETQEWKSNDDNALRQFLKMYPELTVLEQEIPTTKLGIVIQGKVFYDGPNPMGIDEYPFVPVLAYYNPQMPYFPWRVQGIVRGLRDAQYLYNRRKIIELDILESQVNSGWIYKENALVNPADVFLNGQGRGIALKEEASMSDVQRIEAPNIPASLIQLSEILAKEVMEISGVNEELLGSATDDKAGILSMLRQGAGLTTLQILFDQLDHSQKMLGTVMLRVIETNFTPGKIKSILEGEEPTEQFYNKAFGKYSIAIEEGINTTTQRQMQFAQLLELKQIGVPIPDDILLDTCTVQNKKQLMERIQEINKAQEESQQIQTQAAVDEQNARTELARARAVADQGLGIERMSRVEENESLAIERKAKARREDDEGLLNLVRALKEIETIDLSHVEKIIQLANIVKSQEISMNMETQAGAAKDALPLQVMQQQQQERMAQQQSMMQQNNQQEQPEQNPTEQQNPMQNSSAQGS